MLSSSPGIVLQSIINLQPKFRRIDQLDIDWNQWMNVNLFTYIDMSINSNNSICKKLNNLIIESNNINPSQTDIVMLAHIIECSSKFGLPIKSFI